MNDYDNGLCLIYSENKNTAYFDEIFFIIWISRNMSSSTVSLCILSYLTRLEFSVLS